MYYCELNSKRNEKSFFLHYSRCTCLLAHAWYYYKSSQADHIRAYWEDKGDMTVRFHKNIGVLLHYPKGISIALSSNNRIGYPY